MHIQVRSLVLKGNSGDDNMMLDPH